ncbi:hypothetical protein VA7868_01292 [Vibrio aerogenes CECT 7868]|uniref:DUF4250 domain-containing protein n=1 Tax=Vibrio aerogenes CECT 7868 TaxID=1216006 RepID=A0A1M5XSE5_9VIBR|nr:DUF4250 domain-containing protein [Vibrio aerogenes]SHI02745.1 hypothetical protein VA7868_01292 [Vibrio aerogenes CECT 7868]
MDLSNVGKLDSPILLGIVNEKLRLECDSFDDLTVTYEFDSELVIDKLAGMGYQYDPLTNQFKAI